MDAPLGQVNFLSQTNQSEKEQVQCGIIKAIGFLVADFSGMHLDLESLVGLETRLRDPDQL